MSAKVTRGDFSGTASILVDSPFFRNVLLLTLIFDSTCSLDEPRLSLFKSTKFVLDLELMVGEAGLDDDDGISFRL